MKVSDSKRFMTLEERSKLSTFLTFTVYLISIPSDKVICGVSSTLNGFKKKNIIIAQWISALYPNSEENCQVY